MIGKQKNHIWLYFFSGTYHFEEHGEYVMEVFNNDDKLVCNKMKEVKDGRFAYIRKLRGLWYSSSQYIHFIYCIYTHDHSFSFVILCIIMHRM